MRNKLIPLAAVMAFAVVLSGCSTSLSRSYTFNVDSGDSIKVTADLKKDVDIVLKNEGSGFDIVVKDQEPADPEDTSHIILEGSFDYGDAYDAWYETIEADEMYSTLEEGTIGDNPYHFYDIGAGALWIQVKVGDTTVYLYSIKSVEETKAAFEALSFELVEGTSEADRSDPSPEPAAQ